MWRQRGDLSYSFLTFVIFCFEVAGLGVLTLAFAGQLFGVLPFAAVLAGLIAVVTVTAIALCVLTGYVLVYHALSRAREQQRAERVAEWTDQWVKAIYDEDATPPLTDQSTEAGLNLRHLLSGEEGRTVAEGLWRNGAVAGLLRKLQSSRMTDRMEALDGMSKARLPATLPMVVGLMTSPEPIIRLMATRAAARTLSEWFGPGRAEAFQTFADALPRADLPAGAMAEMLLLIEDNAPGVVARLLSDPDAQPRVLRATLDAVGRLGLMEFAYEAAVRTNHSDPEVRAAALRALGRLGRVPMRARDTVVIALADDTEFVRVQAARAAAFVPARIAVTALYQALGDRSWWVRRAAAESMLHRGRWGLAALKKAARAHTDGFARDMASQVMLDAGLLRPQGVPPLKATA
jgi:HEAT repeat protein